MRGWDKFKYYTLEDKKSTLLGQSSTILKTNKIQENSDRNALKCSGTHCNDQCNGVKPFT